MKFSAAKMANLGVVMAKMLGKMGEIEKGIKRSQHHVWVLSKRNHGLIAKGKRREVLSQIRMSKADFK